MESSLIVNLKNGAVYCYTDDENRRFDFQVIDGHLWITETLAPLVPNGKTWRTPRNVRVFPPKVWIEVIVQYGD
jgi:hypothetical protein